MTDALTPVVDLFKAIPVRIRQTLYGLLALVVLVDGALDLLPDRIGDGATVLFGLFVPIMALANTVKPPPPPLEPLRPAALRDAGESVLATILIVLAIVLIVAFLFGWVRP